jgi:RecA-family ATPase
MAVETHHEASRFLVDVFGASTACPIFVASLANPDAKKDARQEGPRDILTRAVPVIEGFVQRWDLSGRGTYFCVATLKRDAQTRSKATLAEINCLHVDLDCTNIAETPEQILQVLARLPLPPNYVIASGHGYHAYWLFKEGMPANPESIADIERRLKRLVELFAGDPAVPECSRLMRLPGTFNTKNGERLAVKIVAECAGRYDLVELDEWLDNVAAPYLHRKSKSGNGSDPDAFQATADMWDEKAPIDIEDKLTEMVYLGPGGGGNAHDTLLRCSAAMLSRGENIDTVVAELLEALRQAAGRSGASINDTREERIIRGMCDAWLAKHPEIGEQPAAKRNGEPGSKRPPLPFINISNWDNESVPPREWAVPDRIPLRQAHLFSGEGAAGKSTIGMHQCFAHALARDWLGTMPRPGPTLFIDAEDDDDELHRRAFAIINHYGATFEEAVQGGIHLMSLAGEDAVLAVPTRGGKIEPTPLYQQLLEAAGDIRPVMMVIASSANVYAGDENIRPQVQQFAGLLTRLAKLAGGSVSLISHPSLTGINTDTGLSGTTQWHNAFRSRHYLKSIKPEAGEQPDSDIREIVFKKNNYGPISESIVLRWQNGLFLPVQGIQSLDRLAQEDQANEVFLTILRRFALANRNVSDKTGTKYAPAMFAREDEAKKAGASSKLLASAMRRLFQAGKIWNEPCGPPSKHQYRLAIKM